MENKRKKYTSAQNIALVTQVEMACPLCSEPLFNEKCNSSYKNYEIAHIYPLNPTIEEIELLENEDRLSADVNGENNVIPLCVGCHKKFDKPRTLGEYRQLVAIKKQLIEQSNQKALWKHYQIESEISFIIEALYSGEDLCNDCEISYNPKEIDRKLNDSISNPTKRKIKNNVTDYFIFIKKKFALMEMNSPDRSNLISSQIKIYYLKQKTFNLSQQEVFENIVAWINSNTKPETREAAEILASFFVQNCEIFE